MLSYSKIGTAHTPLCTLTKIQRDPEDIKITSITITLVSGRGVKVFGTSYTLGKCLKNK